MPFQMHRVSPFACRIEKAGSMHVPGMIYLSPALEASADKGSLAQVAAVASLPGIVGESIAMPDIHIGYGFPIGGVAAFAAEGGIISPGGIGFDINCGVRLLATDLDAKTVTEFLPELLDLLAKAVPVGTGRESSIKLTHEQLDEVLTRGAGWARANGYATDDDLAHTEENGCLAGADAACVSHRAKDRGVGQLGTLGSGNHFLEIQQVDKILDPAIATVYGLRPSQVVILIHCGSRGVGHQVCSDYLRAMEDAYPDITLSIPDKNLMFAPLASDLGQRYKRAMAAAANYAWCNRQIIAHQVRSVFKRIFPHSSVKLVYDVSHNIAKFETHIVDGVSRELCVHRKGATRSFPPGHAEIPDVYRAVGQPVFVPGSMGTASWVLAGAAGAMERTFGSCCHGAGRTMSRTEALATLDGARIKSDLRERGILVKAASTKGIAEEAPSAYKDVDEVIRVVAEAGLATPVARLTPLGVLKG